LTTLDAEARLSRLGRGRTADAQDQLRGGFTYQRAYLVPRRSGGPACTRWMSLLGLTRDAYSPLVIGWFCRLATRSASRSPVGSGENVPRVRAPDLGDRASGSWAWLGPLMVYLSDGPLPENEGDVLVIENRRQGRPHRHGPRAGPAPKVAARGEQGCKCQRHRGRAKRKRGGRKKRRKKGDKSKNGRSATLVVMDTLRRGEDVGCTAPSTRRCSEPSARGSPRFNGRGPRRPRRGFPRETDKTVQIVIDGEICLEQRLRRLFPKAILTLDVRHAQEKLWEVRSAVPPGRRRGAVALGRGIGSVVVQGACACLYCNGWSKSGVG